MKTGALSCNLRHVSSRVECAVSRVINECATVDMKTHFRIKFGPKLETTKFEDPGDPMQVVINEISTKVNLVFSLCNGLDS